MHERGWQPWFSILRLRLKNRGKPLLIEEYIQGEVYTCTLINPNLSLSCDVIPELPALSMPPLCIESLLEFRSEQALFLTQLGPPNLKNRIFNVRKPTQSPN